jgi:hypothetical protein
MALWELYVIVSISRRFVSIVPNYKLEIKKFSRLANRRRNTYCPTDTINNQFIRAKLHSVKTEYKFLLLPHDSPSSFNSHKWPDSLGHYSIAVKDPLRVDNGICLDESLPENSR